MSFPITGYIPCYNNAATVAGALASLQRQTVPLEELLAVDDGSTDGSRELCQRQGVKIIRHATNLGRGAARARAMEEAKHEFVLCCDATNELAPDFSARALRWFDDPAVAAVVGRITQRPAGNVIERWRGRHLFKLDQPVAIRRRVTLATFGAMVRRSAVLAVGNYDRTLRHSEDGDLGERLLAAGYEVVSDPSLEITSVASNTLGEVLERYWRWYAGKDEAASWSDYFRQIAFSLKGMALQDLRAGDPFSVPISLLSPHYRFWRSRRKSSSAFGRSRNAEMKRIKR